MIFTGKWSRRYVPVASLTLLLAGLTLLSVTAQESENPSSIKGAAFGIDGRAAFGKKPGNQSPWGGTGLVVQPTGLHSYLRLTAGVPFSRSDMVKESTVSTVEDLYVGIEHEWLMKYFGVSAGLGLMYLHGYEIARSSATSGTLRGTYDTLAYPESMLLNWILSIRAGTTMSGFRGRVSLPLLVGQNVNEPQNLFFDYSAIGYFGNNRIKGGLGFQGMLRIWGRSFVESDCGSPYGDCISDYPEELREFQAMVPVGKFAVLLAEHNVVVASIEIGGILVPRIGTHPWAPGVGLGYVYSLGRLDSPDALDGRF